MAAMQPGCVPWKWSNSLIISRSTTCTQTDEYYCNADPACIWHKIDGYCMSQYCSFIPTPSCTHNPRCQLSSQSVCEEKPLMCDVFTTQSDCQSASILCAWNSNFGGVCQWTDFETLPTYYFGSKTYQTAALLFPFIEGPSGTPWSGSMDFARPQLNTMVSVGILNDPFVIAGGGVPFLQARRDGTFASASLSQAMFDSNPGISLIYGQKGPCDCYRDFKCVIPTTHLTLSGHTMVVNNSCTLYDTVLALPMTFFSADVLPIFGIPAESIDLIGSVSVPELLATHGIASLEDAFRSAFILSAVPAIDHRAYYDAIGPVSCGYSANIVTTPVQALTIVRVPLFYVCLHATHSLTFLICTPFARSGSRYYWRSLGIAGYSDGLSG